MSNSYFRFKEFTIHQDKCAMKVSTDACIQGAWTTLPEHASDVLDIGTGTGLLSLMLAQRYSNISIDALELDKDAAAQAATNIQASPWADRIQVICADATTYNYPHQYDFIIANPPFFNNSLLGPSNQRNQARHTLTLSYEALFDIIQQNLKAGGEASVLLPIEGLATWQQIIAANNWHIATQLVIVPTEGRTANRVVVNCKRDNVRSTHIQELVIRHSSGDYTTNFEDLLYPYYLDK